MPEREEILEQFRELRRTGDRRLRNELIEQHRWIAVHCSRRFANRGEPLHDLLQVAQLGVLKAVERYDPAYGVNFATFAVPTVLGELRRHFRDFTWPVRVPRRVKELHLELAAAIEELGQTLRRPPRVSELADHMATTEEDVLVAMEANAAYRTATLTAPSDRDDSDDEHGQEAATLGDDDPDLALAEARITVRRLLRDLPERERRILYLRFFENRTQSEIGEQIGLSQVHVSRLLRTSLDTLQERIDPSALAELLEGSR